MIITRLKGGLGNQMFQYAVGRRLAQARNTRLYLDKSFYRMHHQPNITSRNYSLDKYNIKAHVVPDLAARILFYPEFSSPAGRLRSTLIPLCTVRTESGAQFDPDILHVPNNTIIDGYWQTDKYFRDIRNIILNDLTPLSELTLRCRLIEEQIFGREIASVHVRRGDYVTNPIAATNHGTCPPEWYRKAVNLIGERRTIDGFLIFSDDIEWTKENLSFIPNAIFVDRSMTADEHEDLHLMSQCHHNIIANSSFSWWAAWLNNHPHKTVIAPKQWFRTEFASPDRLPTDWIAI